MADERKEKVYLITGATGLVGSNLAETLVSHGCKVRCFVRPNSDTTFLDKLNVDIIQGDLTKAVSLEGAVEGVDIVYHCAAMVSDWADRETMAKINVGGTENVIGACLKNNVKRMIMLSSLAVLGMDTQIKADETSPYVYTGDNYNYTKIEAEKRVLQACREKNLPGVIIRPPYIYGPRDRQFLPRIIQFLKEGKFMFIGSGENPFSLVYVKNLVKALCLATENANAVGQIFHITDGRDLTRKEFIDMLAEKLRYPKPEKHVPEKVAKAVCPVLELINKITKSKQPPILNKFKLKFLLTPLTFDISKAENVLGYKPLYTYEQAIEESVKWFKEKDLTLTGVV